MKWVGAFAFRDLLTNCIVEEHPWPPERNGIYVVSTRPWRRKPSRDAGVLYVGGNTGRSARFRTRIGDLVADLFGFYGSETGHHSGGQRLWRYCNEERVSPLELYIGWAEDVSCGACEENAHYDELAPSLSAVRPKRCAIVHGAPTGSRRGKAR